MQADNTLLWCWLASSGGGGILPNDNIPWSQFVFFYGWMVCPRLYFLSPERCDFELKLLQPLSFRFLGLLLLFFLMRPIYAKIIIFIFSVVFSVKILCRLCAMRRNRHFVAVDSSNVISGVLSRRTVPQCACRNQRFTLCWAQVLFAPVSIL